MGGVAGRQPAGGGVVPSLQVMGGAEGRDSAGKLTGIILQCLTFLLRLRKAALGCCGRRWLRVRNRARPIDIQMGVMSQLDIPLKMLAPP